MSSELAAQRRGIKAAKNFKEYLEFVIRIKPATHQTEWLEACQDIGNNATGQRYCIIAPPGAGKSVFIGVGFVSWIIGKNPTKHYGLLSYSDQVAWDRAKPIRDVIEKSPGFNYAFPDTVPDLTSWDRRGFRVEREDLADPHPTLRAGGVSSAVVSYRLNGLVLDDVLDIKTAVTAKSRKKAYDDYVDAISTRMVKNAWQLCIGTRWSDDDFIGGLLKLKHHGAPLWIPIHIPAILPNGKSYWPEQYSLDEGEDNLLEKKDVNPSNFALQYQGDTTGGETQIITKVAAFNKYKKDHNGKPHAEWVKERDLMMGASWDSVTEDQPVTLRYQGRPLVLSMDELWNRGTDEIEAGGRQLRRLVGYEVWDRRGWSLVTTVSRHYYTGKVSAVTARSGGVVVTPNHSLISFDGSPMRPADLAPRTNLPAPPWSSVPHRGEKRLAKYCHKLPPTRFIGTLEFAWACGLFLAEGWAGRVPNGVEWSNNDRVLLERAGRAVEDNLHVKTFIHGNKLSCHDERAWTYFVKFYDRRREKMVPDDLFGASDDVRRAFYDGYMAGDGFIDKKTGQPEFVTTSPIMAQQMAWIVNELTGMRPRFYWRTDKRNVNRLRFTNAKQDTLSNIVYSKPYSSWVYDLTTESGTFRAGVGGILVHNTALKDGQENDYSVMYIGGLDKHGNIWIIDREKERFTISEIVRLSKECYLTWKTYNIWFEDSAVGTPAVTTIREEMPQVPCSTVYYGGGKRSRANVLAQYLHNGQVRFPSMASWFPDMEYYLKHFPYVDHDDDVDSLFILVDNLLQLQHPAGYADRPRASLDMR